MVGGHYTPLYVHGRSFQDELKSWISLELTRAEGGGAETALPGAKRVIIEEKLSDFWEIFRDFASAYLIIKIFW